MKRIIISRTDAIGDVVLTLPLASIIRKQMDATIIFFGRNYTKPVCTLSDAVDEFVSYDDFINAGNGERVQFLKSMNADAILHVFPRREIAVAAKAAAIPLRIGTSHRFYHLFTCNRLQYFSRKRSDLHEAQLNAKLLAGLGLPSDYSRQELAHNYRFRVPLPLSEKWQKLLSREKMNILLHPHSHGSAREWGLANFRTLAEALYKSGFNVFISGSSAESEELKSWTERLSDGIHDMTGKFSLEEFISFINAADGIVAGSTGPLHIAAALGKHALGIYPPIRPMHAGRWAPLGKKAQYVSLDKSCNDCSRNPAACKCIRAIDPETLMNLILQWTKS